MIVLLENFVLNQVALVHKTFDKIVTKIFFKYLKYVHNP